MIDLFYPIIPRRAGRVIRQRVMLEENEVERKKRAARERQRRYYLANKDKCRAANKKWQAANQEHYDKIHKQWQEKNWPRILKLRANYRARNLEEVRRKDREAKAIKRAALRNELAR